MFGKGLAGDALGSVANASFTTTLSIVVFFVLLVLAWRTSKGTMISFVLGIILAGTVFQAFGDTSFYKEFIEKQSGIFFVNLGIYSVLIVCSTLVIKRFIYESFSNSFWLKILQIITVVFIVEGVLFVHLYKILHIEKFYTLSPFFTLLFGSEYAMLGWFLILFVGLCIIRNNK